MRQRFLIDSAEAFPMGQGVAVTVNGKALLIIHTADGFYAVLNHCPHMGLRLDNGTIVGKVLVCLWHGALFDLTTGASLRWAANEPRPEAIGETRRPLITFPVIIEDGQVFVEMELIAVFENLDKVNWKSLNVEAVPELLKGLLSADENNADDLLNELFSLIYGEQTLHTASLDVIPFLIDILPSVQLEIKRDLLMLLTELASDISYTSITNPRYELSRRCHDAVGKGLDVYLEIACTQEGLKHSVTNLLYCLPEAAKRTLPALMTFRRSENDEYLRARITLTIGHLLIQNPTYPDVEKSEYLRLLEDWFRAEMSSQVKFAAGVVIVNLLKETTPKEIRDYVSTSFNQGNMALFHGNSYLALTQDLLKLDPR